MVVGLGNPGKHYEATRHNAGFLAADLLCKKHGMTCGKLMHRALCAFCTVGGHVVLVAKPQTYMNLSGESVRDLARAYHVPVQNIIVVFDDAALASGRVRVRRNGSDGGHNGIKSIIFQLQSDDFPRLKLGIGQPDRQQTDMADYVLSDMDCETMNAIKLAPEIIETMITSGTAAAMDRYNAK